jgi:hypothetical protein
MKLATSIWDTGLTFWRQFKLLDFLVQMIGLEDFTVITNSQQRKVNETSHIDIGYRTYILETVQTAIFSGAADWSRRLHCDNKQPRKEG